MYAHLRQRLRWTQPAPPRLRSLSASGGSSKRVRRFAVYGRARQVLAKGRGLGGRNFAKTCLASFEAWLFLPLAGRRKN